MTITLSTPLFQEMLNKAVKGAGNNKLVPLTFLISIKAKDNILTLTTTDGLNYLYVKEPVETEDFELVVEMETFSKLISKMTSETITLNITDNYLEVVGNGKYLIDIPSDDGNPIRYPDPVSEMDLSEPTDTLSLEMVNKIINNARNSLAQDYSVPGFVNYYVGSTVLSTDRLKICNVDTEVFKDPVLISCATMDLLAIMDKSSINVYRSGNKLVFETSNCVLYANIPEGIEDFDVEVITSLIKEEFPSMCKVSKNAVMQLLDRLSLFVGKFDDNAITVTFTQEGILFSSKKSNGTELVPYIESKNFSEFVAMLDIEMLDSQVKTVDSETIQIYYGNDTALKFVTDDVIQVTAFLEEN